MNKIPSTLIPVNVLRMLFACIPGSHVAEWVMEQPRELWLEAFTIGSGNGLVKSLDDLDPLTLTCFTP